MKISFPPSVPTNRAFSLIELLTIVAIMTIIMSIGVPATSGLFGSSNFNRSVAKVSNLIDQARQYAVTQNTYVWVAFHQSEVGAAGDDSRVGVAVIASTDGTQSVGWDDSVTLPADGLALVNRIEWAEATRLENTAAVGTITNADSRPASSGEDLAEGVTFEIRNPDGNGNLTFDRVILFSPRGEARVDASPVGYADLALQLMRGENADERNFAIIQTSGLTGVSRVFRQ